MKKIFVTLILLLITPITVLAVNESYISYENIKSNGNDIISWWSSEDTFNYGMNDSKNYSFRIKGYNLLENKEYTFSLNSDFTSFKKTYTGKELMEGIDVEREDGNGTIESKVYSEEDKIFLKTKYEDNYFTNTNFFFNSNFDDSELDAYYNKIIKEGALNVDAINPDENIYYEPAISASLQKYVIEPFSIYGYCDEYTNCFLHISDTRYNNHYKAYKVTYSFKESDNVVKEKIEKYIQKFPVIGPDFDENKLFTLDDLENINYKYSLIQYDKYDDLDIINSAINYSSEIQKLLEYGNLTAIMDTRAGWDDEFSSGSFGFLNLKYNDTIYGFIDGAGVKQNNVIYVEDNINSTRDSFIERAKDRIESYLPNVKVSIKYAGQISDLDDTDWVIKINEMVDVTKTLGEYYKLSIGDNEYNFFIARDSSRLKTPEMNTTDLKTNIKINTNSSLVPLDTKVSATIFDNDSNEYKEQIKKTNIKEGIVLDLKLYSNSISEYISELKSGNFKVYIPIDKEYQDKSLIAYYVKDDGSIEKHEVIIKDGYAIFETNHFSTYTIGENTIEAEKSIISNPQTFDDIVNWIIILIISFSGLILLKPCIIKNN